MAGDVVDRERRYGLVMHQVKRMLCAGLISEAEFREMNDHFKAKYHPVTGSVLVETQLLCTGNGVINSIGKEGFSDEENQHAGADRASV